MKYFNYIRHIWAYQILLTISLNAGLSAFCFAEILNLRDGVIEYDYELYLGDACGSDEILDISYDLSIPDVYIGYYGKGTVNINDGLFETYTTYLGYQNGSEGIMNLNETGQIQVLDSIYIGYGGKGTVNISDGFLEINDLYLGFQSDSEGTLNIEAIDTLPFNTPPQVNIKGTTYIANEGYSTINLYGGIFNTNNLSIASDHSMVNGLYLSNGVFNISGSAEVYISHQCVIGDNGVATINLSDGIFSANDLVMSVNYGLGLFNIGKGAYVNVNYAYIGSALINQTGGIFTANGLHLGTSAFSTGSFNISDTAEVYIHSITTIGSEGNAAINQTGGYFTTDYMEIGIVSDIVYDKYHWLYDDEFNFEATLSISGSAKTDISYCWNVGTINQTGGTFTADTLWLGGIIANELKEGIVNISDGILKIYDFFHRQLRKRRI